MSIAPSFAAIESRIAAACTAARRPRESVMLLAVSKTKPAPVIAAAAALGQHAFGENYVQEALPKIAELAALGLDWHHIGPIQSNKTADIAQHFAWAHGVDRLKIAQRLADQRPAHLPPLNVCVQVNVSGEASKSGCAPQDALPLCRAVAQLPRLRLRGLMALPAPAATDEDARASFRTMHSLFVALRAEHAELDTLSMGMSDDFEQAIAEGSTLIRVGTALFGKRGAGKTASEPAS
ncbi:MAG: YggS family pyridoxal phosphate-dependent enzyme [Stagnimonas sp.]|nr:YggS family pyridoxal phosphate-dependent enzyme [Stagnimonas sp.]